MGLGSRCIWAAGSEVLCPGGCGHKRLASVAGVGPADTETWFQMRTVPRAACLSALPRLLGQGGKLLGWQFWCALSCGPQV